MSDQEPVALFVYKTHSVGDPFTGKISFFKVVSGVVRTDSTIENYTRKGQERLSHLSVMQGRKAVEVTELHAGDLGAVAKLRDTFTGDTLGQKGAEIRVEPEARPEPSMTYAIEPETRARMKTSWLVRCTRLWRRTSWCGSSVTPRRTSFWWPGLGSSTVEAIVSRLKRRYHTEVTLKAPKVPYRETIRGKAEAQGRHKKQSGGLWAVVWRLQRFRISELLPLARDLSLGTRYSAGRFRGSTCQRWRRGLSRQRCEDFLPGIRWWTSRRQSTTAAITRGGFERIVVQGGGAKGFSSGDGGCQAVPAGADHEGGCRGSGGVCRSADGRFERPPRTGAGHAGARPDDAGGGGGSDVGDVELRDNSDFADAGARKLSHGDEALRRGAAGSGREDCSYGEEAGGGRGEIKRVPLLPGHSTLINAMQR